MTVTREWRVYALGATLLVALTMCSRNVADRGGPYFMASLTLAGLAYLLAIDEFFATPTFPRRVVVIGLVLAAVWHIAFLRLPAGTDDDIHRYVWDGRLQRLGYNPYIVVPSDPAFAALHTPETHTLNNSDLPSPYPAGAQLFVRAVTAIDESTFAMKVAFVVCDFGIALLLIDLLRGGRRTASCFERVRLSAAPSFESKDVTPRPKAVAFQTGAQARVFPQPLTNERAHLVLAYAWNPLLAIEVAGSGHIDIVGALLLVISVAALARRWRTIAAVAFGLAVAVKFLPIVLLPLYWKRVRIRDAAFAAAVVAFLYVPFLNHGRIPIGSLGTYVTGFRFNGPVFAILHRVAPPELLAGLAVLSGLATATWLRSRVPEPSLQAFAWPMAASLLCAPVVFPWYLLWLLPFLTSASTLLISVWTVSIIPTYIMWHLSALRGSWGSLPGWVMLLEYGCVAMAAAVVALRRRKFPTQAKSAGMGHRSD